MVYDRFYGKIKYWIKKILKTQPHKKQKKTEKKKQNSTMFYNECVFYKLRSLPLCIMFDSSNNCVGSCRKLLFCGNVQGMFHIKTYLQADDTEQLCVLKLFVK